MRFPASPIPATAASHGSWFRPMAGRRGRRRRSRSRCTPRLLPASPPGGGTAVEGARVFGENCTPCHGEGGKGSPLAPAPLFGGAPLTSGIETPKTIGNFFGYSTIVFDFVRRAMPFSQPRTLTGDEVYAATAYLLWLNKIIGENDVMDARTLPQVKMPNRDGFIIRFPDKI